MPAKQTDPQYKLRLPEELHARLADEARSSNRSMNAEIVARLQASLDNVSVSLSDEEKSNIVMATTMQVMTGVRAAINEIPNAERGNIEGVLDLAWQELARKLSSGSRT